jgi:hypothetical protein
MTHYPRSLRLGVLLVLGAVSVGALLTPTAHAAAAQMLSVFVTNTAANPVPVMLEIQKLATSHGTCS